MSWWNDPDEAARHPRQSLAFMLVAGLVAGGLFGFFRFGHSLIWAASFAAAFAAILTRIGWASIRGPSRVQQRARRATIGLALLFSTLGLAFGIGVVTHSVAVFVVVLALGLGTTLIFRFALRR